MRTKVILVTSTFIHEKRGGVPTFVENRAHYLSKKCRVLVCGLGKAHQDGEVQFASIGTIGFFRFFFFISWIKLAIIYFKNRDSVIEIHNIPVGFPLFFIAKSRFVFHGPSRLEAQVENKSRLRQLLVYAIESICLRFSAKLFTASKAFKQLLAKEHPARIRVVERIGIIYPKFRLRSKINTQKPTNQFVIVRRLVKRTGVFEFTQMFTQMLHRGILPADTSLVIAGIGPEHSRIARLVAKSGFSSNIKMLGAIDDEQKNKLFQTATLNIVPSLSLEGFGLVIVEAGINGCRSLVANVGGMPEVIEKLKDQGYLFEMNQSSCLNFFQQADYQNYDRSKLAEITQKEFFFN